MGTSARHLVVTRASEASLRSKAAQWSCYGSLRRQGVSATSRTNPGNPGNPDPRYQAAFIVGETSVCFYTCDMSMGMSKKNLIHTFGKVYFFNGFTDDDDP